MLAEVYSRNIGLYFSLPLSQFMNHFNNINQYIFSYIHFQKDSIIIHIALLNMVISNVHF